MGLSITIGIDEAGRGPWAGPMSAAAVAWSEEINLDGLTDSKKLSSAKRALLVVDIIKQAQGVGLGWCSVNEIDNLGLSDANALAMQRAYRQLSIRSSRVVIDGVVNYLPQVAEVEIMPRADLNVPAVSAASIVAKYYRDLYMVSVAKVYPGYDFELHKGYGTQKHSAALARLGPSPIHRYSFAPIKILSSGVDR